MVDNSNLSIVVVSYKSEKVLADLLPSIPYDSELIIVNNGPENLPQNLKNIRSFIEIHDGQNKGFGKACNVGVEAASNELILLINPDSILEKNCLVNLIEAMKRVPNASAFAPKIVNARGKEEFKRRSVLLNRKKWMKGPPSDIAEISIMGGAAIFLKKEIFIRVGGFDENIFLFHEDDDLSLRLKAQIGPLVYVPNAKIVHIGGSSSVRSPEIAKIKGFNMGRSRVYAMKKHKIKNFKLKCLFFALIQLLSLEMIFLKRKRYKYISFYQGVIKGIKED